MAGRKSDLGPTGRTVAANVNRLREGQNLTFAELSRRLGEADRPIPTLGLRKIESGDRRVDADDLVALAYVLGTTPIALLFPPSEQHVLTITGAGAQPAHNVWKWAKGETPINYTNVPDSVPQENRVTYRQAFFEAQTDPAAQDWTNAPNIQVVTDASGSSADGDG